MPRPAEPKIARGAKVRLLRDVTTRGRVRFRAGVVLRVEETHSGYWLGVWVRGRHHTLRLLKKDAGRYFALHAPAPRQESDGAD